MIELIIAALFALSMTLFYLAEAKPKQPVKQEPEERTLSELQELIAFHTS